MFAFWMFILALGVLAALKHWSRRFWETTLKDEVVLRPIILRQGMGLAEPEPTAKVLPSGQPAQPAPKPTQRRPRNPRWTRKASLRQIRKLRRRRIAENRRWHLSRAA